MNAKKLFLNLLLFIVTLISLVSIVNAQEDFTASSTGTVNLCPCSNQAYTVTVENTGTIASSYVVLANGAAKEWVTFNPDKFILNPGQKGAFSVIVNSVCNTEGDYDLETFIIANNRLTKVVKQALKFSQCYDYSLDYGEVVEEARESISFLPYESPYLLCKNEQKAVPILITNNENFGNKYKVFLDAPEWAKLNVDSASLVAKKSGIFLINFDTTDIEGKFNFKLNAISELGKVQRKKNIEVNVEECYALEIELEKEKDTICSGEDKSYEITVKNIGALGQNVKLELDAPEWVSLGNVSFFDLNPEEEKTATLSVNPEDDVSGSFLVTALAIIENKTKSIDDMQFDVVPKLACYQADISTKTSVTNLYSEDLFFAKVRNDGIKKTHYKVSLDGVSWVSVSPETLELNSGQTGNLNLIVNPGTGVEPGTYGVKINLDSNGAVYSKNVDLVLRKESEFMKKLKENVKFYQYYIYLLIVIVILIIIFRKPIIRIKNKTQKNYEKYKVKQEKLRALKISRKEKEEERKKEEEKKKKKELEEKEKARKKETEKKESKKKIKILKKISINKLWYYVLLFVVAVIFIGHNARLFNAKYLHIYIKNIFIGYLYYILIGVGTIVVLFLLVLFYNYLGKKGKMPKNQRFLAPTTLEKKKVKKVVKKAEKKTKKGTEWYNKPSYVIAIFLPIIILLAALAYLNLFDDIRDFFVLYQYYFVLGILILIVIILLIRFYKPLFEFLKE